MVSHSQESIFFMWEIGESNSHRNQDCSTIQSWFTMGTKEDINSTTRSTEWDVRETYILSDQTSTENNSTQCCQSCWSGLWLVPLHLARLQDQEARFSKQSRKQRSLFPLCGYGYAHHTIIYQGRFNNENSHYLLPTARYLECKWIPPPQTAAVVELVYSVKPATWLTFPAIQTICLNREDLSTWSEIEKCKCQVLFTISFTPPCIFFTCFSTGGGSVLFPRTAG